MGCAGTPVAVGRWAEGGGRGPWLATAADSEQLYWEGGDYCG